MKKKVVKGIIIAVLAVLVLFVVLLFLSEAEEPTPDPNNDPNKGNVVTTNNLNITVVNNVTVINENQASYDNGKDLKLNIEPAGDADVINVTESGTTRDGKEWKSDGKTVVVDNKKVTVDKNSSNKDNGKVASVVSALSGKKGYTKGTDDYNHNYAVYYIEAAECMLYYPKQLTLVKEGEDQSLVFRDSRSNAEMTVYLSKNSFASMDEVESLIANSDYNTILASGTDWFSAETYGKNTTKFSHTGLGNKYAVNIDFTYEKKYSFVFEELRGLIKTKFINKGVWVSNAKANTAGKKVKAVEESPSAYDPVLKRTSYYIKDFSCVLAYPDIFSKVYSTGDEVFFTDPKTGACISVTRTKSDSSIGDIQNMIDAKNSDLVSDHSMRAYDDGQMMFITVRDGYMWVALMEYDTDYEGVYSDAYSMFEINIEGDDINSTEVKEIYFPAFNCYVTVPVSFEEYGTDGDVHLIKDSITGMEARLSFSEMSDSTDADNLYNLFNVVAEDNNVRLGEDNVKWHNINGLFMGAAGRYYSALLELTYPNAYSVYKNCWQDFGIYFSAGSELITDAEEIREEAIAVAVLEAAKENIVDENVSEAEVFSKADKNSKVENANTSKTLKDNGKTAGDGKKDSDKTDSENDVTPNKILVYKTENDYLDVITDGYTWIYGFEEIFPKPRDTKTARYYTILYSINVLAYNGYTIPDYASDVYEAADVIDGYVRYLMECDEQIDTQLGEGVVSVFEALCFYLGIDEVPQYYNSELKLSYEDNPVVSDKNGTNTVKPDAEPTPKPTAEPTPVPDEPNDPNQDYVYDHYDVETTYSWLSFDDIPNIVKENTIYGSLTYISYELSKTVEDELIDALYELYELGFECVYESRDEYESVFWLSGYMPETATDMLVVVTITDYDATVIWMIDDESFFMSAGSLDYYDVDFSFDKLQEIASCFEYFVNSIYQYEGYNSEYSYKFTEATYNIYDTGIDDYTQGAFDSAYDDEVTFKTIQAGYYDGYVFVPVHTFIYLEAEGCTLLVKDNGVEQIY